MRRMRFFASRNAREILRDPISVGFGVAFPILLLLLLSFLNRHIPAEAHMTLFEPEQLAPGVSVFSLSFLALFSALLLSRDRSSALILRLYASPLTGRDFILGYLLPMLPMALAQTLVCLLAAIPLGLPVSWRILACTAVNVPIALVNLALGMLCGTLLPEKAVGGMCGALLTNVSAWLSGIWFSLGEDGSSAPVDDSLAALPYGAYTMTELRCEANEGLELITRSFWIERDSTVAKAVWMGLDDQEGPRISTTA